MGYFLQGFLFYYPYILKSHVFAVNQWYKFVENWDERGK